MSTKPYQTRASDLRPVWHVIDAEGKTPGRLSSEIAVLLQGKHKPIYVRHLNSGDYVIVINAGKIRVTGKKLDQKMYYRHSGYHGGLKEQTLAQLLQKTPTRVLKYAVKGMLPKNALGRRMLSRLKLYAGNTHPHEAQVNAGQKTSKAAAPAAAPKTQAQEAAPAAAPKTQAQEAAPTATPKTQAQEAAPATAPKSRAKKATSTTAPKSRAKKATSTTAPKSRAKKATSTTAPKSRAKKATSTTAPKSRAKKATSTTAPKSRAKKATPTASRKTEESS